MRYPEGVKLRLSRPLYSNHAIALTLHQMRSPFTHFWLLFLQQ
ncbi:hypothetical protein [Nostoc commune]|nr:hypothetical protein [Nostoc commune]